MNSKKVIIATIIVLIGSLGYISYLLLRQRQENQDMSKLFTIEKEEMENEYNSFANQYNELQMVTTNDSLSTLLSKEKTKIQRLLEELRVTKSTNAAEIYRLKKELKTLRAVLKKYITEIDSLNRINKALASENKAVKRKYRQATQKIDNLSKEKKTLDEKVQLASQLDATNIVVLPKNKRNKTTNRVKKIVKFAISFTLTKNITTESGERTLYIRIAKPNHTILSKSSANTFSFENKEIGYSIKKYIEYTGEEQDIAVYWDVEEFLESGTYQVFIFADNYMIGSKQFELK
ncbi:MAG: hypothetical protein WCQ82_00900 [Bacteroidaceae bacterium]|nr:hypothetical protein [Bacteroidaceae bacterium]